MKYLKIKNDGLLDIRLVYLMGGTTKSNDRYKIGQFGTGLKYTIAYMLRNNIDFKIFIDSKEVVLSTVKENIRDTDFEIICINGDKTSITTNMGLDWKPWMIIRELWCNALDEVNPICEIVDCIAPSNNSTEYYIQLVPEINYVWINWSKYFIHNQEPFFDHEDFSLYTGGESLRCYKHGVLIKEIQNQKSVFAYDFKNASLNELREMLGSVDANISYALPYFNKKSAEYFIDHIKDTYESKMDFEWYTSKYGEGWKEALGSGKYCDYETYQRVEDKYPEIKDQPVVQVPKGLFKKLHSQFPSISLVRASDKLNEFFETYSERLVDKVQKCRGILDSVGYFIDPNLKIICGVFGNKEIMAQVSRDDKEIRLNQDLESMSDSDLIVALIEENEHYKTNFSDCTRDFQNHFIKLYSNHLLKDVKVLL